jgi:hypothetical protein
MGHRDAWRGGTPTCVAGSRLFVLPRWRVQNIDTPEDWQRAELMVRVAEEGIVQTKRAAKGSPGLASERDCPQL